MSTWLKTLVTLGLVLPLGAFVAGSLAASGADEPAPRETIVIRDAPTGSPSGIPSESPSPHVERSRTPSPTDDASPEDDDGPEVLTPSLDDLGDDHGGDRHGGDDADGSDSGHGSDDSGSSHSGHGSDDSGSSHGGHGSDDGGGGHG